MLTVHTGTNQMLERVNLAGIPAPLGSLMICQGPRYRRTDRQIHRYHQLDPITNGQRYNNISFVLIHIKLLYNGTGRDVFVLFIICV